jgi:iron complex outermembrane receptor protein
MKQTEDRNDRGHSGWLIAPVLLMTALCANAKDSSTYAKDAAHAKDSSTLAKDAAHATDSAAAQTSAPAQDAAQTVSTPSTNPNAPQQLEEVVVTGSRIARPVTDRLEPTVVIGADTLSDRGLHDVGQALTELPGFGVQPASQHNVQSNFGIGQSFVDLYSLGSQRTLVLVNGRRFVSSNTASLNSSSAPGEQVDLNTIPDALIERIETVSVGGAPIYGADAISGTVNILLKQDYQGIDGDVKFGESGRRDAHNYKASLLAGQNFADGRGNITGVLEFIKSDGLSGLQRDVFRNAPGFLAPATPGKFQTVLMPDTKVNAISTSGVPYLDDFFYVPGLPAGLIGVVNGAGQPLAFSPGSSALTPYSLGNATGNPIFWQGGDGVDLNRFTNLQVESEGINADMLGHFDWTDHVQTYWEGWFSDGHGTDLIQQPQYYTTFFGTPGTPNGDLRVSVNNPYLSAADSALIKQQLAAYQASGFPLNGGVPFDPSWNPNTFYLARASTDLQSGMATGDQVLGRGVLGMKGDFNALNRNFNWDVTANYGYSRNISKQPAIVFQNLQNAINSVRDASGNIVCAPGQPNSPVATTSDTCAPLNPFGEGSPSRAAKAYVTHIAFAESYNTQRDFTANFGGTIIKLPADNWKFNVGFENRREAAVFLPDDFYTSNPPAGGLTTTGIEGAYHTNEIYGETLIPIFEPAQNIPVLHLVELDGAVRHVNNSIAGSSLTRTYGFRWAPTKDLTFRANKTRSIRAPAITELFLPAATSFEFANDPCDKNFSGQGPDPATRQANCRKAGLNPTSFTSNVVNATATGTTSGNTSLQSEIADSKTWGVVLTPRWIPRLSLTFDYIDINMTNAIEQLNLVEIMDACYDATDYPSNPSCGLFTRNAAGQVTNFHDGFVNAGILHFQGDTVALQWQTGLPWNLGGIALQGNYLDTKTLKLQVGSAAPQNLAGALAALGNTVAVPKNRTTLSIDYLKGPFSWYWQGQFYSGMKFDNQDTPTTKNIESVGHWWLINSTLSYDVLDNVHVRFIVDNVFDKLPPQFALAGVGGNFSSATSLYFDGIMGRTYQLEVEAKFK